MHYALDILWNNFNIIHVLISQIPINKSKYKDVDEKLSYKK